ncbi:hypothetical protein O0L34_g11046 [Tuta absoluta]|nr:hypothetical protein O0L34_g11046 [Tuta absoluta]
MLLILALFLIFGVFKTKSEEDLSNCLKISDFTTKVEFEEVNGTWSTILTESHRYVTIHCTDMTIIPANDGDMERVKEYCSDTIDINWEKPIQKVSYTDPKYKLRTLFPLVSKKDGNFVLLHTAFEKCSETMSVEFRKYGDTILWFAWGDPLAFKTSRKEKRRCLIDDTSDSYYYFHNYFLCEPADNV